MPGLWDKGTIRIFGPAEESFGNLEVKGSDTRDNELYEVMKRSGSLKRSKIHSESTRSTIMKGGWK